MIKYFGVIFLLFVGSFALAQNQSNTDKYKSFLDQFEKDYNAVDGKSFDRFFAKYKNACQNKLINEKIKTLFNQQKKFNLDARTKVAYDKEDEIKKSIDKMIESKKPSKKCSDGPAPIDHMVNRFAGSTEINLTFFDPVINLDLAALNECIDEKIAYENSLYDVCSSLKFPDIKYQCEKDKFSDFAAYIRACYMIETGYRSSRNKYQEINQKTQGTNTKVKKPKTVQ